MLIKVTNKDNKKEFLIETNNIYCIRRHEDSSLIIYKDDQEEEIKESLNEILKKQAMLLK